MTQKLLAYNPVNYDVFIGIDVDKNNFAVTFKKHMETTTRSIKIPSVPEYLLNYIKKEFPGKRVICVYESGPTGYHLYDYMKKEKQTCVMTPPHTIPRAPGDKVKTNRLDSVRLAQELETGKLKTIRVPEAEYRELRYLIKSREDAVLMGKISKQRIKALLLHSNLYTLIKDIEGNWSNRYIRCLENLECSPAIRIRLDMLLSDLRHARKQKLSIILNLRKFFKEHDKLNKHLKHLQSIPGIGFVTSATILSRIGDPDGLNNPRELGAFLGLVPKERSSGEYINKGSITHMGNAMCRAMLIEASWIAIRKDKELEQFYDRIRLRHHPRFAARKAIVAVARKLTHRIYCVLKEQRDYFVH